MHSRVWRENFSKLLPDDLVCEQTEQTRNFTVASGERLPNLPVWKIPLGIGGRLGEARSAEVPFGTTPLLISVPALRSLHFVITSDDECDTIEFRKLGIVLPLIRLSNRHMGLDVGHFPESLSAQRPKPTVRSSGDDLSVFHIESQNASALICSLDDDFEIEDILIPTSGSPTVSRTDDRIGSHSAKGSKSSSGSPTVRGLDQINDSRVDPLSGSPTVNGGRLCSCLPAGTGSQERRYLR